MAHLEGAVVWFCAMRGFGFIRREGGSDLFVHAGAIASDLRAVRDGVAVMFETCGPDGLQAANVVVVGT